MCRHRQKRRARRGRPPPVVTAEKKKTRRGGVTPPCVAAVEKRRMRRGRPLLSSPSKRRRRGGEVPLVVAIEKGRMRRERSNSLAKENAGTPFVPAVPAPPFSCSVIVVVVWWLRTVIIVGHVGQRVGRVIPSLFAASPFSLKRKKKKRAHPCARPRTCCPTCLSCGGGSKWHGGGC